METYLNEFISLAFVHLLAVVSPGPDFAVAVQQSIKYGVKTGRQTALGIGTGILVHITYIALGFALFLKKSPNFFAAFQYVAAAYLVYLAIMSFKSKPAQDNYSHQHSMDLPGFKKAFLKGFITNAINPKATLFLLSVYTALISPQTPLSIQIGYGVYMAIVTAIWFSIVANLFGNDKIRKKFVSIQHYIDWAIGVVLLLLAVKLIIG